MSSRPRVAVVLLNLGGPDSKKAVKPFLFRLFNDPNIIDLPKLPRLILAKFLSARRAPKTQAIYDKIGGRSPILPLTWRQARKLQAELVKRWEAEVFVVMRYTDPRARNVLKDVVKFDPERVILLPLYPQFSSTTTKSSIQEWYNEAIRAKIEIPISPICCYPVDWSLVLAQAELIRPVYERAKEFGNPRILFSAHGIPQKFVDKGDPYQWQIEQTTMAVVDALNIQGLDYVTCYQSKVGKLKWLGPSTEDEIVRAGNHRVPVVVVPISFVSEHSETLVELDMDYVDLAEKSGIPHYGRVPAMGTNDNFIQTLANACFSVFGHKTIRPNGDGKRLCPLELKGCPCRNL